MNRFLRILWAPLLLVVVVCQGSGDRPLEQVDPDAVPQSPTYDRVYAIVHHACEPCHHSGSEGSDSPVSFARAVAEEDDLDLSTCNGIVSQRFDIWTTVENNTMPPGALPRLTSEEKLTIRRWIDSGAPAPCN